MTATEFLFGLTGIVIAIGIIGAIVKKAHEYGMRVFLSKEYGALILGAILAIVASLSIEPNETGLIVGAGLAALFFALVMIQNIKKLSRVGTLPQFSPFPRPRTLPKLPLTPTRRRDPCNP